MELGIATSHNGPESKFFTASSLDLADLQEKVTPLLNRFSTYKGKKTGKHFIAP